MRIDAPAKLNLRLCVLGRRADGYHAVETLLLRLGLSDTVEVELGEEGVALEVAGPTAGGPGAAPATARTVPRDASNLCCRAARALYEALDRPPGVTIRLTKRIPAAAGLGGGSSDAAAVLLALNQLLGSPLAPAGVVALAGSLGSDVPFFTVRAAHALAWDRGQRLLPLPAPPPRPVLLLVPDFGVSAADAYGWWNEDAGPDGRDPPRLEASSAALPAAASLAEWSVLEALARNDLILPVERRHPHLRSAREALERAGAAVALLCGSGSCVAGIFRSAAERDAGRARLAEEGVTAGWGVITTATEGAAG